MKWYDFPETDCTWETEHSFDNTEPIEEYWNLQAPEAEQLKPVKLNKKVNISQNTRPGRSKDIF